MLSVSTACGNISAKYAVGLQFLFYILQETHGIFKGLLRKKEVLFRRLSEYICITEQNCDRNTASSCASEEIQMRGIKMAERAGKQEWEEEENGTS